MNIAKTKPASAGPVKQRMDVLLLLVTMMLIGMGIVTVFDASYALAIETRHNDAFYFVKRQALFGGIGALAMVLTAYIPFWRWRRNAFPAVCVSVILLIAVFVPHIGHSLNGARRWLGVGPFQFQPSELAKLTLVIYLAQICSAGPKIMRNFKLGVLPPLIVMAVVCGLIAKEPDLGTAIVLCGTGLVMLFVAGARPKYMGGVLGVVGVIVTGYVFSKQYRMDRMTAFLNPKADQFNNGYQVWHALLALGSGGLAGVGLGEGREKFFLPMAPTDFIFAVIAEEWGMIGTMALLIVFTLLAARGYSIAHGTKDPFGALLAVGLTTLVCLQSVINIAVATSSIPNTGVPLPFISYGGSSLVLNMIGIGILLNISKYPEGRGKPEERAVSPGEEAFERRWDRAPYAPRVTPDTLTAYSREASRLTRGAEIDRRRPRTGPAPRRVDRAKKRHLTVDRDE
ncbi:stage V sporulation protein E [Capsulimonas corticalis]|uniref:Probable peptidoglycan glycosyltransferase FtsW n=1 Tax=Capsulimonas corticalis TaxID=2219043 RepID=A0A402D379_9BACT|nr:putative lipid II flippase FtsW [Capsulimonas corticalis]BDI28485.1 stage V sporulation protein E [Capsulimonas corticalis]